MNFFDMHVGDYEAATAHLTVLEDGIYWRMLRIYYRTEKPLPADLKQLCRLVRAQSKPERDAVEQILAEFFELLDDGWHQSRCDAEIARYAAGEPEREVKKANEDNRVRRHRLERAALFKALTDAGQHAPWNIGMTELRALVKALQPVQPATQTVPLPVTAPATPATATQYPLPSTQYPEEENQDPPASRVPPAASPRPSRKCPPGFTLSDDMRQWAREKAPGVDLQAEFEAMRDHTFATARTDWAGTLRNWVRKAAQAKPGYRPKPNTDDPFAGAH